MSVLNEISNLYWREPLWLLLALQPMILIFLRHLTTLRYCKLYAEKELQAWVITHSNSLHAKLFSKNSAYVCAWILLAIAAAGPRSPIETPEKKQALTTNLMLVVDMSQSMHTTDIKPNRLRRTQIEIAELVNRVNKHTRVGMILYAAHPHLFTPLTHDRKALAYYLSFLEDIPLPTRGSQLTDALEFTLAELLPYREPSAVLLFTDGDIDTSHSENLELIAQNYRKSNIPLFILGVGTIEGDSIPGKAGEWLTENGHTVISRMDETRLLRIAKISEGRYSNVRDDDSDWTALYDNGIKVHFKQNRISNDVRTLWQELYVWALIPAIVLLWIALVPIKLIPRIKPVQILIFPLLFLTLPSQNLSAASRESDAYDLLQKGDYVKALKQYSSMTGYAARFGEGVAHYRLSDYPNAIAQFNQAVVTAHDDHERAQALYNLGNSYYHNGNYTLATKSFTEVIVYIPNHAAGRHNRTVSKAMEKIVSDRVTELARSNSMGTGPRRATASESLEINQLGSVTINESTESEAQSTAISELTHITDATLRKLISRGLNQLKIAADHNTIETVHNQHQRELATSELLLQSEILFDQPVTLWKRLFEIEEGFPAPVIEPRVLPGTRQW